MADVWQQAFILSAQTSESHCGTPLLGQAGETTETSTENRFWYRDGSGDWGKLVIPESDFLHSSRQEKHLGEWKENPEVRKDVVLLWAKVGIKK